MIDDAYRQVVEHQAARQGVRLDPPREDIWRDRVDIEVSAALARQGHANPHQKALELLDRAGVPHA